MVDRENVAHRMRQAKNGVSPNKTLNFRTGKKEEYAKMGEDEKES